MKTKKKMGFRTIENWLLNDSPFVYAKVGSSVVWIDGEFDLEQVKCVYDWPKENAK